MSAIIHVSNYFYDRIRLESSAIGPSRCWSCGFESSNSSSSSSSSSRVYLPWEKHTCVHKCKGQAGCQKGITHRAGHPGSLLCKYTDDTSVSQLASLISKPLSLTVTDALVEEYSSRTRTKFGKKFILLFLKHTTLSYTMKKSHS